MRIADTEILIVPGLGNSGPGHWQRRWGDRFRTGRFVEQDDWMAPSAADWIGAIVHATAEAEKPVVIVAHSLGVTAMVHAAPLLHGVRGAFLVAAPDLDHPDIPPEATVFEPMPRDPLPFPSMLVASNTDPFCTIERAAEFATCWGSDFHQAGDAGHINLASGHGPWPEGLLMFTRLMQRLRD